MLSIAVLLVLAAQDPPATAPPVQTAPAPPPAAPVPPRPGPWPAVELPAEPPRPLSELGPAVDPDPAAIAFAPPVQPMAVEVSRDLITDDLRAFAIARVPGARLEIGCDHRRRDGVIVRFSGRVWLARGNAITGERPLTHRFDLDPPRRSYWRIRHRTGTLYERDDIGPFVARLIVADRLVIRTLDVQNREVDIVFPLVAARPAVGHVLELCADERLREELRGRL